MSYVVVADEFAQVHAVVRDSESGFDWKVEESRLLVVVYGDMRGNKVTITVERLAGEHSSMLAEPFEVTETDRQTDSEHIHRPQS